VIPSAGEVPSNQQCSSSSIIRRLSQIVRWVASLAGPLTKYFRARAQRQGTQIFACEEFEYIVFNDLRHGVGMFQRVG
jgi:hypothetical protein